MATAHIAGEPGDFAPIVLMPGDPRRAKLIADECFENARLITNVRGIEGYTGTYQGQPMSVLASGMGIPSITIYATELYRFFGVTRIARVGTAGAISRRIAIKDTVIVTLAHTDSSVSGLRVPGVSMSYGSSFAMIAGAAAAAGDRVHLGPVITSDHFYLQRPEVFDALEANGTLAVEMEAAGLFGVAAAEGAEALAVLTISDHLRTGEQLSAADRETTFREMVSIAAAGLLA